MSGRREFEGITLTNAVSSRSYPDLKTAVFAAAQQPDSSHSFSLPQEVSVEASSDGPVILGERNPRNLSLKMGGRQVEVPGVGRNHAFLSELNQDGERSDSLVIQVGSFFDKTFTEGSAALIVNAPQSRLEFQVRPHHGLTPDELLAAARTHERGATQYVMDLFDPPQKPRSIRRISAI